MFWNVDLCMCCTVLKIPCRFQATLQGCLDSGCFWCFSTWKNFRHFLGYEEKVGWQGQTKDWKQQKLSPVLKIDDWKAKLYKTLYIAYQSRKVVPDSSPAVVLNICSISPCKHYQILFYFSLQTLPNIVLFLPANIT